MEYLLALLSCGRPEYVERTLAAYAELLTPSPAAVYVYDDGGQTPLDAFDAWPGVPVKVESHPTLLGRCAAHANLWRAAAASDLDWVFTVEDDILLLRPLDLRDLAALIDEHDWQARSYGKRGKVAQVALVRCPWGSEIPHGGYIPMSPWKYERRETWTTGPSFAEGDALLAWTASTVDWTSSPALLPTSLTREVEWPEEPGCESELGPRILALRPDAVSAYWGWGEPWVAHIGLERVEGGHGY